MLEYGLEWHTLDTYMQFKEITAPSTPETNQIRQYAKDSGGVSTMCWLNDAGTETCLPTGGGSLVTGAGVVNRLAYWTSASNLDDVPRTFTAGSVLFAHSDFLPQEDNANFFWDDTNNLLTIGTAGSIHGSTSTVRLALDRDDDAVLEISGHGAGKQGVVLLTTSRGTHGSKSIVASGDDAGIIQVQAFDGSVYRNLAFIRFFVDSTPGSNDMPGRMSFWTTPDGSGTPAEAMRINNVGSVGIGGFAPDFRLHLRGTTSPTGNIVYDYAAADATGPGIALNKFRGSFGSEAATQASDVLGNIGFGGWTDVKKFNSARIEAIATTLWTATNADADLLFYTTPTGSLTRAERFRIGQAGQWGIGGATFGGSGDIFSSGGASAPPTWVTRATLNAALDHGTLAGLADDDHTQYALLAGRSGGQTLKGGTAAAGTVKLQATAGVGAGSEQINLLFGNNGADERFRFAIANSQGILRINRPTAGTSPLNVYNVSDAANLASFLGDGANANFSAVEFIASSNGPTFLCAKGRGSLASPGQTLSGDNLLAFASRAYDNSATPAQTADMASFRAVTTENITTTAHGSKWDFLTVPNGSTTQQTVLTIDQDGALELPAAAFARLIERTATPGNPTQDTTVHVYCRANKIIYQWNDAGTVRYKYLDLTGTGVTWVHTTTAPT